MTGTRTRLNKTPSIVNAMTIDVEDYYHVSAFAKCIDRDSWNTFAPRVERNTHRILDLLAESDCTGTFFTLGCVADRHPDLIRRIVREGHEIASHGWSHYRVFEQPKELFYEDIRIARCTLEDISGQGIKGYRAPSFSINTQTPWAYEMLAKAGYTYSSSTHPIKHDHYGDAKAQTRPWTDDASDIVEIPVTTAEHFGQRLPTGGGGFFRLLPYSWFSKNFRDLNAQKQPGNFYLHPWEIDPDQPRIKSAPLKSRFRHYVGLSKCASKFSRLLNDFNWARMDHVYAEALWNEDMGEWRKSSSGISQPDLRATA